MIYSELCTTLSHQQRRYLHNSLTIAVIHIAAVFRRRYCTKYGFSSWEFTPNHDHFSCVHFHALHTKSDRGSELFARFVFSRALGHDYFFRGPMSKFPYNRRPGYNKRPGADPGLNILEGPAFNYMENDSY